MAAKPPRFAQDFSSFFAGLQVEVPVYGDKSTRYINLDNAASTPPLLTVQEAINRFAPYYSSVHRGTGFKSQLSTRAYEDARWRTLYFFGADPRYDTCIFGKNATEAINKLARRFPFSARRNVVLTSGMEHHSNDLPWRAAAQVVHVGLLPDGRLDETDFDRKLEAYEEQVGLVAITGASNVTGYLNPIYRLAEKAHAINAPIMVDCAQLAPHRSISMGQVGQASRLDYISISAHKLYAPYGTGALIGPRESFEQGDPDMSGGGTVEIVTLDDVVWAEPPDREEAGSPNTIGAVALAAALRQLEQIGMEVVSAHEAELTAYALERLARLPGVLVYGDRDPARARDRLGVIPFQMDGMSHFLVAAILGHEYGIGVRSGCFCAHPYILHLLGLTPGQAALVRKRMLAGDKTEMPGLIRISFGLYNTPQDVDALIEALEQIQRGDYRGKYVQDKGTGEYRLVGWDPDFSRFFSIG